MDKKNPTINLSELIGHHYQYSSDQLATVYQRCQEQVSDLGHLLFWRKKVDETFTRLREENEVIKQLFYSCDHEKTVSASGRSEYANLFDFGEFKFQLEGNQVQVYEKELFGWTTLWPQVETGLCRGCKEDQPNQMAHMDLGGCLAPRPFTLTYTYLDSGFLRRFKEYFRLDDSQAELFFNVLQSLS